MLFATAGIYNSTGNPLNRPLDPVIIRGADAANFIDTAPATIVGFMFSNSWHQIPIQVDERVEVSFKKVYNNTDTGMPDSVTFLAYADTNTFTGADTNLLFDGDDEISFMAFDGGSQAPDNTIFPIGTTNNAAEITILNPVNSNVCYIYIFQSDGSLTQDAGKDYIYYSFNLTSGDYKTTYNKDNGPNPETSVATSLYYRTEFSDRWIREVERIYTDGADGTDILDRHRVSLPNNGVPRNEETFTAGEGAFVANINGPIRCIRSYLGANSGPATQRIHFFYKQRQEIKTFLRVHSGIAGPRDTYNYVTTAANMTYYNSENTGGYQIDGSADTIISNTAAWEMVTGTHGTLICNRLVDTDIPSFHQVNYYNDDISQKPPTGNGHCFGMHGSWVNMSNLPSTDPLSGGHNHFISRHIINYLGTNKTVAHATAIEEDILHPLETTITQFHGDSDSDGMADAWELKYFGDLSHNDTSDDDKTTPDGAINIQEYIAGTDPVNSESFPEISISNELSDIIVSFQTINADGDGYAGLHRIYTLKETPSLLTGTWNNIAGYTSITSSGNIVTYTNIIGQYLNFYRIGISLEND